MWAHKFKCEECGRPASYKFVIFQDGKPEEVHYCDDHAAKNSPHIQKPLQPDAFQVHALLQGIAEAGKSAKKVKADIPDVRCKACGLSYEQYKRTLLLGCAECYRSFDKHLTPELRRFHGEVKHIGRGPEREAGAVCEPPAETKSNPASSAAKGQGLTPEAPPQPAPDPAAPAQPSLEELRGRLKKAVQGEEFEVAAKLRDQIRQTERSVQT